MQGEMKRLTPMRAIREHCVECCGGARQGINGPLGCNSRACALFQLRSGRRIKGVSPLRSIRAKCLECVGGSPAEVRRCSDTSCSLYLYRLGKNPSRAGIGNPHPDHLHPQAPTQGDSRPAESLRASKTAPGPSGPRDAKLGPKKRPCGDVGEKSLTAGAERRQCQCRRPCNPRRQQCIRRTGARALAKPCTVSR